ncbi:MAG TPA: AAA family ATPase [Methanothrix sp.]|uniref:AAA family ATPase n=1 Tax=Methanothrix sp. TaxID=90426 RepID=UPI002C6A3928|nr:AAA family ATPase [Methanothrix sp.]MDI9418337.1 AAA family ATPase [Euryarchaeota archaeon]HON35105.1 AAA family ATPase [Methanothrix sp.]HRU74719.1 AAA family ATPase [Methanothrix sp.]
MRSIQKTQAKPQGAKPEKRKAIGARFVLLRPAGYPLKSIFQECPSVSDARLFELYAREQWYGEEVNPGCYLFDRRLYPDYAFQVVKAYPRNSVVGFQTAIKVEQKAEAKKRVSYDVSFEDVVGQEKAKRKVKIVERYLQDPERFGRWAPHNILFYGVSGTGKTMIAKALSARAGVPMLAVKSTSLIGEFVGEGARQIHSLYEKAEEMAPCIIFIDELDAIALDRRYQDLRGDVSEMVNSLLTEMDGISSRLGICTIAATNQIEVLDASVRSRFEEEIEFKLPDEDERLQILEKNARTLPLEMEGVDLKEIARQTEGFSGRDLVEKILKAALHHALMDECSITQQHLEETISRARREFRQPPFEMFS